MTVRSYRIGVTNLGDSSANDYKSYKQRDDISRQIG